MPFENEPVFPAVSVELTFTVERTDGTLGQVDFIVRVGAGTAVPLT